MNRSSSSPVDVAVIGAGAIGLSIAWRAAARGLRVLVLERDRPGAGAAHHAAGMLAPVAEVTPGEEPLLALGLRSAELFPDFVSELELTAEMPVGYTRCGTLLVARDGDEASALERELALRASLGLEVQRLRASAARRLEPGLAPSLRLALDVPGDHAVDPRALVSALTAALRRCGGELEIAAVVSLDVADGGVRGVVLEDGTRVGAERVVVAAGVRSATLGGLPAGELVPLRPVKGQILRLHDPAGPGLLTRVIRMGPSYITPRGDGRYVLGATQEERGFDTTVTAGAAFELLRDASELVPGISELVLDELTAGLRPATPDNLPAIGPAAGIDGLWWAVGHRRGGILLSPVTAELIVAGLTGEDVSAGTGADAAFDPARFAGRPTLGSAA
ncbi:MAG TPA: glycine oxidase ThiO [Solirubrobacteraceae bacterium]|nr:glycine oxidase ThiO [Solirubrobacteraceae bacterium]